MKQLRPGQLCFVKSNVQAIFCPNGREVFAMEELRYVRPSDLFPHLCWVMLEGDAVPTVIPKDSILPITRGPRISTPRFEGQARWEDIEDVIGWKPKGLAQ